MGVATILIIALGRYITFDRTGKIEGDTLYWNGSVYVPCSGEFSEGKTIAKTTDGWQINEVKEDESHSFVVVRSFLDQYLMVRDDFYVPTNGQISVVVWNGIKITDGEFCRALSDIIRKVEELHQHRTDDFVELTDNSRMYEVHVGYEGCPIATSFIGYIGDVDGTWYFAPYSSSIVSSVGTGQSSNSLSYYSIPEEYFALLALHSQF